MDSLRGGHCWCRWRADGAVRRGDFGQIGYRDYTPGGCHARSSDPALTQHASTDRLSPIVHGLSSNLMGTIGLVFAGGSLVEWGGGLYSLVPTVILSVLGGVLSA